MRTFLTDFAEGGCLCGAVRYRVSGAPVAMSRCHCTSCRRASGAPSIAWVVVRTVDFAVVAGQLASFCSSPSVVRTFCGTCGTPVTYRHEESPDTIDITTATFDFPGQFAPTREVWLEHRLAWEPVNDALQHFPRSSMEPGP
jgi:hypothetical protein